jgi:cytochrome c553
VSHGFLRWCLGMAVVALMAGCAAKPSPQPEAPVAYHMNDHLARTIVIQQSLALGNLEAARPAAQWLEDHIVPDALAGDQQAYVAQMKLSAGSIAIASDVEVAAQELGKMGASCGACHQATGAQIIFAWVDPVPFSSETTAHMYRHIWAVDRLWQGLVGPSEEAWDAGAKVLTDLPLHRTRTTAGPGRRYRAEAWEELVHELGATATEDADQFQRAELLGEILGACHNCHRLLGITG